MLLSRQKEHSGAKAAKDFLQKVISRGPWEVIAGVKAVQIQPGADKKLSDALLDADQAKANCTIVLPLVGGLVNHIVVQAPSGTNNRKLEADPNWTVFAQDDYLVWCLSNPVPAPEAQATAARFAKAVGGKPIIGKAIPLPGSMAYKVLRPGFADRRQVFCLPLSKAAYRLADGRLASSAKPAPAPMDKAALNVRIGDSDAGPVFWTPSNEPNGFMLIAGASGSGKTETIRAVASHIHKFGAPVLTFAFHKDLIIPGSRDILLSSGTDSTYGLNPLELDGACGKESGLYDHRGAICSMLFRAMSGLGHNQRDEFVDALEKAYVNAGILDHDPATWGNPPPTFASFLDSIENRGLKAAIRALFAHPLFNRENHLKLDDILKQSTRLGLYTLDPSARFIVTQTLLQRLFRKLTLMGPISRNAPDRERYRVFAIIDEARILATGGGENFLDVLFAEARKFGLGMILATQLVDDFSEVVKGNAGTRIILKPLDMAEAVKNAKTAGVEPEALMKLKGKGDGYYRAGAMSARRVQVRATS